MTVQQSQWNWHVLPEYPLWVQTEKSAPDGRIWGCVIANCDSSDFLSDEEKRANAQLIAVLPDLLEAVEELIEVLEAQPETDEGADALAKAYRAIAKAEGKKSIPPEEY